MIGRGLDIFTVFLYCYVKVALRKKSTKILKEVLARGFLDINIFFIMYKWATVGYKLKYSNITNYVKPDGPLLHLLITRTYFDAVEIQISRNKLFYNTFTLIIVSNNTTVVGHLT